MNIKIALEAGISLSSNSELSIKRKTKILKEETKVGGLLLSTLETNSLWRVSHHDDFEGTKSYNGRHIDIVKLYQLILKIHNPNSGTSGDVSYQLMLKTKQSPNQTFAVFSEQFSNSVVSINVNGGVNGQQIEESETIIPFLGLLNEDTRSRPTPELFL